MILPLALAVLQAQGPAPLTLTQAVDRALASHPSVAAARALRDRATADLGDARSAERPRVSLDASFSQFQKPMVVLPLHSIDPRNPPLFDRSLVQSGVTAGWTVFDFGQRAARIGAQHALGDAAAASTTSAERQLMARTAVAYMDVLTDRDVLAAHDQRIAALDAATNRVRQLVTEGKSARVDQLRVEAESQRARADRIGAASQLALAEQELAQLTGVTAATVQHAQFSRLRITDTSYIGDTSDAYREALVARALRSSSEVNESELRERATSAGLALAQAARYPEVRASGAYVDRGRVAGNFAAEWQLGLAITYPAYTGGSNGYAIDRASADDRAAKAQVRLAQMGVESGVDRTLATMRETHARWAALQSAALQSAEVSRIERLSLDVGSATQTDFLDAESNLLQVRASAIEAQRAEMAARVELARIVGELSREWLARTMETPQ